MSGVELLNISTGDDPIIPFEAHRALHNVPAFYDKGIVIDIVEYPEPRHVGVRCYEGQVARMNVEDRAALYERMKMMVGILRSYQVSASMEKVGGNPPTNAGR